MNPHLRQRRKIMGLGKKLNDHSHEEQENDELWAISYGDMITLLLSFFVIFFSTDFKKNKADQVDNHLLSKFKVTHFTNERSPASIADNTAMEGKSITAIGKVEDADGKKAEAITKKGEIDGDKGQGKKADDAPKFELLKNAKITKINDRLLVTFEHMNFFKTAIIEPNEEGTQTLKAFAEKFVPYAGVYKISVKAFTDKRPVKNGHRFKDNMELSTLRALAALRVLQEAGIPLDRLEIAGYGEMNKLQALITPEKFKELSTTELLDVSRTIILIIKHDNEQSVI